MSRTCMRLNSRTIGRTGCQAKPGHEIVQSPRIMKVGSGLRLHPNLVNTFSMGRLEGRGTASSPYSWLICCCIYFSIIVLGGCRESSMRRTTWTVFAFEGDELAQSRRRRREESEKIIERRWKQEKRYAEAGSPQCLPSQPYTGVLLPKQSFRSAI